MAAREATLDYVSGAPEKAKATIKESLGDKRAREQARAPEGRMFIPNPRMMGSFIDEKVCAWLSVASMWLTSTNA